MAVYTPTKNQAFEKLEDKNRQMNQINIARLNMYLEKKPKIF